MISRTFSPNLLNEVANHPEVRPQIGPGDEPLDLGELVRNPANIAIETEHGGWLLIQLLPGVYELHTLMLKAGRGKAYFRAANEALRYVFTTTDALEILTRCPDDNPPAKMAATLVGFRERERREAVWNTGTPTECGISFQALTLDDWIKRDKVIGEEGAMTLCSIEAVQPSENPLDGDELLNRLVGAVVLMMRGGQTPKAIAVFNRAAAFYGYSPIVALRGDLADIGGCLVHVKPEGVGVLSTL